MNSYLFLCPASSFLINDSYLLCKTCISTTCIYEIKVGCVDWIHLACGKDLLFAFVNMVMKLRFP